MKPLSPIDKKTRIYRWHLRANQHHPEIVKAMKAKIKEITLSLNLPGNHTKKYTKKNWKRKGAPIWKESIKQNVEQSK